MDKLTSESMSIDYPNITHNYWCRLLSVKGVEIFMNKY